MTLLLVKAFLSYKFMPHNWLGKIDICSDNFEELQFGIFFKAVFLFMPFRRWMEARQNTLAELNLFHCSFKGNWF